LALILRLLGPFGVLGAAISLILGILLGVQKMETRHWKKQADQYEALYHHEHATVLGLVEAQEEAKADNQAQVRKIEQQYQRNTDDERQAYLRDLAKLRADRMRSQGKAAPGNPNPAPAPAAPSPSPGADGTRLCVPAESALCEAGAEIELRLMHLQNLLERQLAINPNN
jgi:hypothetical protein